MSESFRFADRRVLKIAAIVSMLLDHVGLLWGVPYFRAAGRMAFPIFAFMLSEGYYHTHDVLSYAHRLARVAVISQIPYALMKGDAVFFAILVPALILSCFDMTLPLGFLLPLVIPTGTFNVLYLFVWGVLMFAYLDGREKDKAAKVAGAKSETPSHRAISLCVWLGAIPVMLRADYSIVGMALFLILYYQRKKSYQSMAVGTAVWSIVVYGVGFMEPTYIIGALLSCVLIACYNDRQTVLPKWLRYIDYGFYPAHMLVLWFLHTYAVSLF